VKELQKLVQAQAPVVGVEVPAGRRAHRSQRATGDLVNVVTQRLDEVVNDTVQVHADIEAG